MIEDVKLILIDYKNQRKQAKNNGRSSKARRLAKNIKKMKNKLNSIEMINSAPIVLEDIIPVCQENIVQEVKMSYFICD